jgi:tryptophanyl-tRNA synthetase
VPTYKDQQEKLANKDLSTYGFLGYPLLMSADILIYRADKVPVGEDQIPHVEFTRELARRFNHMYGREPGFEDKAREAVKKLGSKKARLYEECATASSRTATRRPSSRPRPCSTKSSTCRRSIASACSATSKAPAR